MKVKHGESVIWLFFKINLSEKVINEKVSSRALHSSLIWLFIGVLLKISITLFPGFTFIPKTWRNTLWSGEGVRKVFFFSELSRNFGRQRVVRSLKLLAIFPGRTMR